MLPTGEGEGVLGQRVLAPSTCGTFLRLFSSVTFVSSMPRRSRALTAAWAAGPVPQINIRHAQAEARHLPYQQDGPYFDRQAVRRPEAHSRPGCLRRRLDTCTTEP